jgi:hypothetical protein
MWIHDCLFGIITASFSNRGKIGVILDKANMHTFNAVLEWIGETNKIIKPQTIDE